MTFPMSMLKHILVIDMYIVLGRFQPFHKGHEILVQAALEMGPTVIAIGSSEADIGFDNPWTADERESMIKSWLGERDAEIVHIPDINDPPNWVSHASKFHGDGVLVTSDLATKELYQNADFDVHWIDLENRESYEGWRVRTTLKMLSTVYEQEAQIEVMSVSIPSNVVSWLIENDALHRLYAMSKEIERVG